MKQILILMLIISAGCNSHQSAGPEHDKTAHDQQNSGMAIPLNDGKKWKADEVTKSNVAVLAQIANDSIYQSVDKRRQLSDEIQSRLDTLIGQCSMKGPAHDALHLWLEKILKDVKDLKEGHGEYGVVYSALKRDIENFYSSFE